MATEQSQIKAELFDIAKEHVRLHALHKQYLAQYKDAVNTGNVERRAELDRMVRLSANAEFAQYSRLKHACKYDQSLCDAVIAGALVEAAE